MMKSYSKKDTNGARAVAFKIKKSCARSFDPVRERTNRLQIITCIAGKDYKYKPGTLIKVSDPAHATRYILVTNKEREQADRERVRYIALSRECDPLSEMGVGAPDTARAIEAQERQEEAFNPLRLLGYEDGVRATAARLRHAKGEGGDAAK